VPHEAWKERRRPGLPSGLGDLRPGEVPANSRAAWRAGSKPLAEVSGIAVHLALSVRIALALYAAVLSR